jgi:hypothetical protein
MLVCCQLPPIAAVSKLTCSWKYRILRAISSQRFTCRKKATTPSDDDLARSGCPYAPAEPVSNQTMLY